MKASQTRLAFGAKLATIREALGLSQTEAGKRLGRSRESLSLIERGQFTYTPEPPELGAFEAVLGIPQVEQLQLLGYNVQALSLVGEVHLSAEEIDLLNSFRRLEPALRRVGTRLVAALGEPPALPSVATA